MPNHIGPETRPRVVSIDDRLAEAAEQVEEIKAWPKDYAIAVDGVVIAEVSHVDLTDPDA
jgi:hypothetical protein